MAILSFMSKNEESSSDPYATAYPRLFGSDYSVYVRISRLALIEKGVEYTLIPIDVFSAATLTPDYLERHPFGKIPAFEHNGFRLYETGAITRYIDEVFPGKALQPSDARSRARMNQIISIADNYIYPELVWGMYVELVEKAARGEAPDDQRIATARAKMPLCLKALSEFLADCSWLCGDRISLADLYVAAMFDYFLRVPEGEWALPETPALHAWWRRMEQRASIRLTRPAS